MRPARPAVAYNSGSCAWRYEHRTEFALRLVASHKRNCSPDASPPHVQRRIAPARRRLTNTNGADILKSFDRVAGLVSFRACASARRAVSSIETTFARQIPRGSRVVFWVMTGVPTSCGTRSPEETHALRRAQLGASVPRK